MCKRIRKFAAIVVVLLFVAFIALQFVPVDRSNPPVSMDVTATPAVAAVLRQSCYDCHSHEVKWNWYGYVAPVSWLIAKDVREGRDSLNFSTWDQYTASEQIDLIKESYEDTVEGEMPPSKYLLTHRSAKITEEDLEILRQWANEFNLQEQPDDD